MLHQNQGRTETNGSDNSGSNGGRGDGGDDSDGDGDHDNDIGLIGSTGNTHHLFEKKGALVNESSAIGREATAVTEQSQAVTASPGSAPIPGHNQRPQNSAGVKRNPGRPATTTCARA